MTAVEAAQGSAPPPPHSGQATTTIALPAITVTDPNGSTRTITLGSLVAHAVNESSPFASLGVPGWQIDSSGGAQSGNHDIPVTTSAASGDVDIVNYDVHADATTASSSYGTLTATASTTPVDLQADLGQHGVSARVTPDASTGSLDLTVTGLQLGIGDLLPADVLNALPLTGLVQIVSGLGLPLPAGATSLTSTLSTLSGHLTSAQHLADQLATARTTLAGLLAALPGTAAAQQQLTNAQTTLSSDLAALQSAQQQLASDTATMQQLQTQVAGLTAAVTAAQQQVNSLTAQITSLLGNPLNAAQIAALTVQLNSAQAALTSAQAALAPVQTQLGQATVTVTADQQLVTVTQQQVSTDQASVTSAQQALDALVNAISNDQAVTDAKAAVDQLTSSLTSAIATVSADITGLPNLATLRTQLLSALTSAPLVNVGTLGATLSSTADDTSGAGTITCTISGATVLGHSIPNGSCTDLVGHFAAITTAVAGALDQLPVAVPVVPTLDGLVQATVQTTPTATDTATNGGASVSPLHLSLPSSGLTAFADTSVTSLLSALNGAQQSFSTLGLPAVTSVLSGSLGTLAGTVGALPTGSALAGLHTLGVDVRTVGLSTSAVHNLALSATPTPTSSGGYGGGSTGGGNPGGGHPGKVGTPTPTPRPTPTPAAPPRVTTAQHDPLPFTGDNTAADLAVALIALLAGAHGVRLGRRTN